MKPFSDKDLQRLNDAYKDVKSFSGQAAATAMRRVQAMSGEAVLQIAWANIRWLSTIATREARRRWENTDKSWKLAGLMVGGAPMSARATNPYLELKAIGAEMDNHESDLYVKATPEVVTIVKGTGWSYSFFKHQTDGVQWIDIPFAYMPYWDKKDKGAI